MISVTKGYSGSGKTKKLIKKVNELLHGGVRGEEIIVLTRNGREAERLKAYIDKTVSIYSTDKFLSLMMKKIPSRMTMKHLSDFSAQLLISSILKTEGSICGRYTNTYNSGIFAGYLYNTFLTWKNSGLEKGDFLNILRKVTPGSEEGEILETISDVFDKYCETLIVKNYADYADVGVAVAKETEASFAYENIIKNKYKYIFIDDFENITFPFFEIVRTLSKYTEIYLYFDEYSRITTYKGAFSSATDEVFLRKSFKNIKIETAEVPAAKRGITDRAVYLVDRFDKKSVSEPNFGKSEKIRYVVLPDKVSEIRFVAEDIEEKIRKHNISLSEIVVALPDFDSAVEAKDMLFGIGIPVKSNAADNGFVKFVELFAVRAEVADILLKNNIERISPGIIKVVEKMSRYEKESFLTILNPVLKTLLRMENLKHFAISSGAEDDILLLKTVAESDGVKTVFTKKFNEYIAAYKEGKLTECAILSAGELFAEENTEKFKIEAGNFCQELQKLQEFAKETDIKINFENLTEFMKKYRISSDIQTEALNVITFFEAAGTKAKHVYTLFLNESIFPKRANLTYFVSPVTEKAVSSALRSEFPQAVDLIEKRESGLSEESRILYTVMSSAEESLTICSHKSDGGREEEPSVFFNVLATKDAENYEERTGGAEIFSAKNGWLGFGYGYDKKEKEPVVSSDNLVLSYSSISDYQKCPRLFYFKNLLNLKEESTYEATYGSVIHAVFEIFALLPEREKTAELFLNLAEILLNSKTEPERARKVGFSEKHIELTANTCILDTAEMKDNIKEAIEEAKEFFEEAANIVSTEIPFEFSLESIPGVLFRGKIDAIVEKNGIYNVYDYKTGKTKASPTYLLNEETVKFLNPRNPDKGQFNENLTTKYEWQIPIYMLAFEYAENLKPFGNKLNEIGYIYIRSKKSGGYLRDTVTLEKYRAVKDILINNLKIYVADKIEEDKEFTPKEDKYFCESICSYGFICDAEAKNDED